MALFYMLGHKVISNTSSMFEMACYIKKGPTLVMSTAYHPQTDGQFRALNHCIEMYLGCFFMSIHRDKLLSTLKLNLARAQNRMKQIADRKRVDVGFQIGDMERDSSQQYWPLPLGTFEDGPQHLPELICITNTGS
ncbi:hypothetical protein CR513_32508, partial [Mucuna pruriens]